MEGECNKCNDSSRTERHFKVAKKTNTVFREGCVLLEGFGFADPCEPRIPASAVLFLSPCAD